MEIRIALYILQTNFRTYHVAADLYPARLSSQCCAHVADLCSAYFADQCSGSQKYQLKDAADEDSLLETLLDESDNTPSAAVDGVGISGFDNEGGLPLTGALTRGEGGV